MKLNPVNNLRATGMPHTTKFMGSGQLLDRLAEQMRTQKNPPKDPRATAIAILQARGQMKEDGKTFTQAGQARNEMTAKERAIDRATKRTDAPESKMIYSPKTNRVTLRK